jgi:hypothetical protein
LTAEQGQAFTRGFQPKLWSQILQQLQLKLSDHFPDDPCSLDELHDAAKYILHSTALSFVASTSSPISMAALEGSGTSLVKTKDLAAMFERMTETFIKALMQQQGNPSEPGERPARMNLTNYICNFCGETGHIIHNCKLCEEYITAGKCIQNSEGRMVLPSGASIPQNILGRYMKERFNKWHRTNPGQMAAAQLMLGVLSNKISVNKPKPVPTIATRTTHPELLASPKLASQEFTMQDHINAIEHKLFYLQRRGADKCP